MYIAGKLRPRPDVWDGDATRRKVKSGEWRVKSYLIDTQSILSVSAQSFKSGPRPPTTERIIQR